MSKRKPNSKQTQNGKETTSSSSSSNDRGNPQSALDYARDGTPAAEVGNPPPANPSQAQATTPRNDLREGNSPQTQRDLSGDKNKGGYDTHYNHVDFYSFIFSFL